MPLLVSLDLQMDMAVETLQKRLLICVGILVGCLEVARVEISLLRKLLLGYSAPRVAVSWLRFCW